MIENEPLARFKLWLSEAEVSEPEDHNAMTLATVSPNGMPSARMVLLKDVNERGFVFYTNLESRKAVELSANPRAALCFHWKSVRRQVRVEGEVHQVTDAEADEYFETRPKVSQLGAWASKQSEPLKGRYELEARLAKVTARYAIGPVPRPPHWSGYCLAPSRIEFWEDRPFRLHMRQEFVRQGASWTCQELYP